jgi:hypothetical protein
MWHALDNREKYTRFWWKKTKERDHSEDRDVYGRMWSEWILGRKAGEVWNGFNWLRIRTGSGLL